jgi:excisionase family DNA binding protein
MTQTPLHSEFSESISKGFFGAPVLGTREPTPFASGVRNVLGLGGLETFVLNTANAVQKGMNAKHLPAIDSLNGSAVAALARQELPLTVRDAAAYLGVSVQTVYLWVERKQIPHLRVMGRNIRFLKSDLEPFRAQFKQEVGSAKTE